MPPRPPLELSVADGSPLRPYWEHGLYSVDSTMSDYVAPTVTSIGRGPVLLLGPYDTRPDEEPYQADVHQGLQPKGCRGGVVLRMGVPAAYNGAAAPFSPAGNNVFYNGQTPDGALPYAPVTPVNQFGVLSLYVGGFDFVEELSGVGMTGGVWYETASVSGPDQGLYPSTLDSPFAIGRRPNQNATLTKGWEWMRRRWLRPRLSMLPYMLSGPAEFDLSALAGGSRYVWAAVMWTHVLNNLTDWFATNNSQYNFPYSVRPGKPVRACHEDVFHFGVCKLMPLVTVVANLPGINAQHLVSFAAPYGGKVLAWAGLAGGGVNGFFGVYEALGPSWVQGFGAAAGAGNQTFTSPRTAPAVPVSLPTPNTVELPSTTGSLVLYGGGPTADGAGSQPRNPMALYASVIRGGA